MSRANAVENWNSRKVEDKTLIDNFVTAAKYGKLENVKNLFERMQKKGVSVDSPMSEDDGYDGPPPPNALMAACENGQTDTVRFLVENGANVNSVQKVMGNTALMFACHNGNLEIVRYLCQNGADPNIINNTGLKAIDVTLDSNIQKFLLEGCSSAQGGRRRSYKTRNRRNRQKRSKRTTRVRK